MEFEMLLGIIACPSCKSKLKFNKNELACLNCNKKYKVVNNIPILLDEESKKEINSDLTKCSAIKPEILQDFLKSHIKDVNFLKNLKKKVKFLLTPPSPSLNLRYPKISRVLHKYLNSTSLVLNIGGLRSTDKIYFNFNLVNLQIHLGPDVNLVGDAHKLPFQDTTLDGVIAQGVLEHVRDPSLVVSEIYRVLKKGGLVYAAIPFIQSCHYGPRDFRRYTIEGINQLFSRFEKIVSEPNAGPATALTWILRDFIISFAQTRLLRNILRFVAGWFVFPIKYFDYILIKDKRYISAASFYFIGKK